MKRGDGYRVHITLPGQDMTDPLGQTAKVFIYDETQEAMLTTGSTWVKVQEGASYIDKALVLPPAVLPLLRDELTQSAPADDRAYNTLREWMEYERRRVDAVLGMDH